MLLILQQSPGENKDKVFPTFGSKLAMRMDNIAFQCTTPIQIAIVDRHAWMTMYVAHTLSMEMVGVN